MQIDNDVKWLIEKAIPVVLAFLGALGSGKLLGNKKASEPPKPEGVNGPDWVSFVAEQREAIQDLQERVDSLEQAIRRKDRFILRLQLYIGQLRGVVNTHERALGMAVTIWEDIEEDEE